MWTRPSVPLVLAVALASIFAQRESIAQNRTPANQSLTLWKQLKRSLTGPDGKDYFEMAVKGALLPALKGKVVRLEPETDPATIVLAVEDGVTPDATLKFEKPLNGKVRSGTELSFEGVGESYTGDPFMIVFDLDTAHLHGWPRSR